MQTRIFILALLAIFLGGCATTRLEKPLPEHSRVGVASTLDSQASFRQVGATVFQNSTYKHKLSDLNLSQYIDKLVTIRLNKFYQAIPIVVNKTDLMTQSFMVINDADRFKQDSVINLMKKNKTHYLIIISDGDMPLPDRYDSNVSLSSYGIYRGYLFGKMAERVFLYGAFHIYVITDIPNFKILASYNDSLAQNISPQAWGDKFNEIPPSHRQELSEWLKRDFATSITENVLYVMRV